jgi:hypothetical protein
VHLRAILPIFAFAALLPAQDGQQGSRPGWPCVAGRAIDPAYLNISETTGGQLFLFQKGEAAHSGILMSAPYTHPATVLRLVGNLNGTRDLEFPVDPSIESLLVLISLQCRKEIRVLRPSGSELTAANTAQSIDLAAGKTLRVDLPEPGKWRIRLDGTGLFVLSGLAKPELRLTAVTVSTRALQFHLTWQPSNLAAHLVDAAGGNLSPPDTPQKTGGAAYQTDLAPQTGRFRLVVTGEDGAAWPFQRVHPVLFSPPPRQ